MTVLMKGCGFDSSIQDRPFPVRQQTVGALGDTPRAVAPERWCSGIQRSTTSALDRPNSSVARGFHSVINPRPSMTRIAVQRRIDDHAPFALARTQGVKSVFSNL